MQCLISVSGQKVPHTEKNSPQYKLGDRIKREAQSLE